MAKVWSFNTTIRNPERMENMLRALRELEGVEFDAQGQERFFALQIKKRLYKPERRTLQEQELIEAVYDETSADDLDDSIVERIVEKYRGKDVDGSGRGRTAAGILNRFGLCVALQSRGQVVITDLAKKWLEHEIEDEELFTKFFLKWQYPNEIEAGYNEFNIKPFVGTLSLISKVNEKWKALGNKPVGLSKREYQLFVPSLSDANQIEEYAKRIVSYRSEKESRTGTDKTDFMKEFASIRGREIFGADKDMDVILSDLNDYTDSSIRYFRMSGLIALRGKDTHVDIAKDKEVEVASLIEAISSNASEFSTYEEYFAYLSDISTPALPWENEEDLQKITQKLSAVIQEESGDEDISEYLSKIENLATKDKVGSLEETLNQIRVQKLRDLRYDLDALDECIARLENITARNYDALTARPSLDLEWYVSRALMVINDAKDIAPSFNLGDDGIPTGFRANVSDIECYYESFGMTVETTLLLGRDQWYAEGQPVMRHFRDFEDKLGKDSSFCIFIAPLIHRDTLNTFWGSSKAGYEGKKQMIIPLTLGQFILILKGARKKIEVGNLTHLVIHNLLNSLAGGITQFENPHDWLEVIPTTIETWS